MCNEDLVMLIRENKDSMERLGELYTNNLQIIRKIANKYTAYAEIEDLLQEGYCGLCMAVQHYDINSEIKFATYATYWIRQAIQRYIENCCHIIRIPVHMSSDVMRYKKALEQYREEHGRQPSDIEMCERMECSMKKMHSIKKAWQQYDIRSLDAEVRNDNGDTVTLIETLTGCDGIEESIIENEMNNEMKTGLWQIVQDSLTDSENDIITERYQNNRTRQEVADIMCEGVSYVRSIEEKAMRKLRVPRIKMILEERFDIAVQRAYRGGIVSDNVFYSSTERAAFKDMRIRI